MSRLGILVIAVTSCCVQVAECATILPVGPYGFDSWAEFDSNFKRGSGSVQRDGAGFVYIRSGTFGSAVYDTSATGGSGGGGGVTGSDANNDLSNFTIKASVSGTVGGSTPAQVGFYLRLDATEANGYLAAVALTSSTQVTVSLWEQSSVSSVGTLLHTQAILVSGTTVQSGLWYPFAVTASGSAFVFDFNNGSAVGSYADSTLSRTIGQVGFMLSQSSARLDNFAITAVVPEPSSSVLVLIGLVGSVTCGVMRHSRKRQK